ncbi:unnamed protein product [Closterium sp. NIES-53]
MCTEAVTVSIHETPLHLFHALTPLGLVPPVCTRAVELCSDTSTLVSHLNYLALVPAVCTGAAAAMATSTRAPTAAARDVPQSTRGMWAAHPAGTSHSNAPSSFPLSPFPFSPTSFSPFPPSSCLPSAAAAAASSPSESPPSPAAPSRTPSVSSSAAAACDGQASCMGRHSQRGVEMASHAADGDASAADIVGDSDAAAADGDASAGAGEDGVDGCRADGPEQIRGGGSTRHAEGKGT